MTKSKTTKTFDKYHYYQSSVQSPESDVEFFRDTFKELKGKEAVSLCEDFCGTYSISCEWIKLDETKKAIGVDLDPEPIEYGNQNHKPKLNSEQQARLQVINGNVLSNEIPKTDIVSASNFSYFIFKSRQQLKEYFTAAFNRVNDGGLFIADIFGGSQCYEPNEEETEHDGFSYFWDQDSFDPVTNFAQFYIHFKREGEKKREQVFSYDWRMWSIPELKDILLEIGYKDVHVYWEGSDEDGDGNGEFERVTQGEDCEGWVAYIVCEK